MKIASPSFSTRAIHTGYQPTSHHGALNPPIYWSSTFAFESAAQGAARFAGEEPGMIYTRVTNPTVQLLEERLAALEGGEAALAFGSGMGAICTLIWTLLRPGDELVVDLTLYGCTHALANHLLPEFGIVTRAVDLSRPENLLEHLNPRTRLVLFETPANPNMRLVDIEAVSALVHARSEALVAVDSTYCTPYLQRPLDLGADVVLHSLTKYMNGHGDVIAGAMIGGAELMGRMRMVGLKELTGACLSPMDAFLVLRGLKTLPVRMDRHCRSARRIAEFLAACPQVEAVYYPGLESHPQHALAMRQMSQPGGMMAFDLDGGVEAGRRFIDALRLVTRAVSLGDAESLAQHPASMTHSTYSEEERRHHLIGDGLVRLSVGLEDEADLIDDLRQALAAAVR
ncbi:MULTISPECIES: methionine gamma-lyase [unclassified Burkholderia]|uniref:methionine gamma-lyase n=1 Tax=unclassified Burkholderia TaxID=2613784 RepID=UPI000469ECFE|nr:MULTISPECIES: methionine gamma-lyase [unclassified Burkholderia]NIE84797.1 methionine gamma-lyase [Burkholderia sp. Tr-860]NIF63257.1 methionine gamma-lyase [Burkholderia sp. Cy-647]NIF96092.1 methionine gamma-lyase [Burkholderia sp. Ax-1720]